MKKQILVPISPAELMDKIAILEIKEKKIADPQKISNIQNELLLLRKVAEDCIDFTPEVHALFEKLKEINENGWKIEDEKRECEKKNDFGDGFIQSARGAFKNNDMRASIWKEINLLLGSDIVQEKSYSKY